MCHQIGTDRGEIARGASHCRVRLTIAHSPGLGFLNLERMACYLQNKICKTEMVGHPSAPPTADMDKDSIQVL